MRLISRNDLVLLGGLTMALFVVVSRPLAQLLEDSRGIEQSSGLRLMPALVILTGVFIFIQLRKRHEERLEGLASAASAKLANERAEEMERLVAFGQALARSLDEDSIRAAGAAHLPVLGQGRSAWVMIRVGGYWKLLTAFGEHTSAADREQAARLALGEPADGVLPSGADACFPMIVAGTPVGVLGVANDPLLGVHQRSTMRAAAALLAVSLKNAELFREVHDNSVRDSLTGCFNRKHSMEVIDAELRRARRSQLPVSLVMFDLDHFKDINDRYGHLCGDAVLAGVGARMRAVLRGSDLKSRYGGEEFLILLPDTPLAGAQRVAETLRRDIEQHPVRWNDELITVTASFGVTTVQPGEVDPLAVMSRADGALYRAKETGRNRVCTAESREAVA